MNPEILRIVRERGVLLEKELFDVLESFGSIELAQTFLEKLVQVSGQKMITRSVLTGNMGFVKQMVQSLAGEEKGGVENVFIKLGISLEVTKEKIVEKKIEVKETKKEEKNNSNNYQLFYTVTKTDKKLELSDFVGHFRARYGQLSKILMQRPDLTNLVGINKIGNERQNLSIIGMVVEKRTTKNGNLIVTFEDLTGKIPILFKVDRSEVFAKAKELLFDDVVAIKGSGDRNMLFGYDVYFPDAFIQDKMRFEEDISIAFISDMHVGSLKHLKKSFQSFLYWLNSDDENAKKVRYLFIVGDNIDGVGVYPGQEYSIELKSTREQYAALAEYLKQVPKHITMFMCPGQHDAVRLAEPQPVIGKSHAPALYEIENLVLVTNPTMVKLIEKGKEFKVLMYHGDSIHDFIREVPELREMKAHKCPAKAVKHMLKRRHLFPMHSLAVYIPQVDLDPMVISEVPDVLCTGEIHRVDVENYNGVLILTGSCWQNQTAFEEKVGNIPDPAKVPILNLKTREFRIFDFGVEGEVLKL
ncbi:MAG: metallophosphoesterase [Nanoarchaeota archaeon]